MTIGEWLALAKAELAQAECPDPQIDARWIAEDILSMKRQDLLFAAERMLTEEEEEALNTCLERRRQGEPIQYILESAYFMGLTLHVDNRVLIPRQDTETLVESVILAMEGRQGVTVLDLCTGSGAIGLSLKNLIPHAVVTLADISKDALEVAKINAHVLNADVVFRQGDLFKAVGHERFDVIVSNPPYIPHADLSALQREVQQEPMLALDGGEDGLDFYRRIAQEAAGHLNAGGQIYLEVGIFEASDVARLLKAAMPEADTGIIRDLNGIERIVFAKMPIKTEV